MNFSIPILGSICVGSTATNNYRNIPKFTHIPLSLKLLKSEIWDIRGLFSLIIMYTFKIKDYNDKKNN